MSLYIGKDNNGNSLLHLTKGVSSETALKTGVQSNTVLHSSLPYIKFSRVSGSLNRYTCHANGWYMYGYKLSMPLDSSMYGKPIFFVANNNKVLSAGSIFGGDHIITWINAAEVCSATSYRSTPDASHTVGFSSLSLGSGSLNSYPSGYFGANDNIISGTFYIIDNIVDYTYVPTTPISDSITINNSTFMLNGIDMLNHRFISSLNPNGTVADGIIPLFTATTPGGTAGNYSYAVDTNAIPNKTVELSTDPVSISVGGTTIYSSASSSTLKYKGKNTYTYTQIELNRIKISDYTFTPGDMFIMSNVLGRATNAPMVYKEGKIAYFGMVVNYNSLGTGEVYVYGQSNELYIIFENNYNLGKTSGSYTNDIVVFATD